MGNGADWIEVRFLDDLELSADVVRNKIIGKGICLCGILLKGGNEDQRVRPHHVFIVVFSTGPPSSRFRCIYAFFSSPFPPPPFVIDLRRFSFVSPLTFICTTLQKFRTRTRNISILVGEPSV